MNTYHDELEFAKELALKAGQIIVSNFATTTSIRIKSNITPVTETDIAVSKLVTEEIATNFPDHILIDEELQNKNSPHEYKWICDPIDGTIPFSRHIPTSVFSLALCKNDEPVVGVIYDPYMKRLVHAMKGQGAYMNDKQIHVSDVNLTPGEVILAVPNWFVNFDYNALFAATKKEKLIVTAVESFVYECMLVATGSCVGAILHPAQPWDRAASILILQEAGGLITDETNMPLTIFGKHWMGIASNQKVHSKIVELVNNCLIK